MHNLKISEEDFVSTLSAIWKAKWFILFTTLAFTGASYFYGINKTKTYQASVEIYQPDLSDLTPIYPRIIQFPHLASALSNNYNNSMFPSPNEIYRLFSKQFLRKKNQENFLKKNSNELYNKSDFGRDLYHDETRRGAELLKVTLRLSGSKPEIIVSTLEKYIDFINKHTIETLRQNRIDLLNHAVESYRSIDNYLAKSIKKSAGLDNQSLKIKRFEIAAFLNYLEELKEREFNLIKVYSVKDNIEIPKTPIKPKLRIFIFIGLLAGFGFSIFCILLRSGIKSYREVKLTHA